MKPLAGEPENGGDGVREADAAAFVVDAILQALDSVSPVSPYSVLPFARSYDNHLILPTPYRKPKHLTKAQLARKKRQHASRRARAITRGTR